MEIHLFEKSRSFTSKSSYRFPLAREGEPCPFSKQRMEGLLA